MLVLFYFLFQCACAGSTSGGLKVDRLFIFFKSIQAQVRKLQHPNAVVPVRMNGTALDPDVMAGVILYTATYIFIVFFVALALSLMDLNIIDCFSASASCMANVGPGFGNSIGSLGNFSDMPFMAKTLLSIEMLLGRLEIYGLLIFFFAKSWR
jgi:trk system potassium uptake protein TrkH